MGRYNGAVTSKLRVLWVSVVVLLAVLVMTGPRAGADEDATCSGENTGVGGVEGDRRTVVAVHGWTGKPLTETSELLEVELGSSWQFLNFDYKNSSNQWASEPAVAGCLVTYLNEVSQAHVGAGGDGVIYLVTHSMGGLAARFAIEDPDLEPRIGGLVTIATPHKGTAWAGENDGYGKFKEAITGGLKGLPDSSSAASRCLGKHSGDQIIEGCDMPPFIDTTIPITTIGGALTITRTFFGVEAYPIIFAGDTIVSSDSATGYADSAPGKITGQSWTPTDVLCTEKMSSLISKYGSRTLPTAGLSATAQLMADYRAAGATSDDKTSLFLLELVVRANSPLGPAPCSHAGLLSDGTTITKTAEALARYADMPAPAVDAAAEVRRSPSEFAIFTTPSGNIECEMDGTAGNERIACLLYEKDYVVPKSEAHADPCFDEVVAEGGDYLNQVNLRKAEGNSEVTWSCYTEIIAYRALDDEYNEEVSWWQEGDPTVDDVIEIDGEYIRTDRYPALGYGTTLQTGDLRCTSEKTGVTCQEISTGRGFMISRANWEKING